MGKCLGQSGSQSGSDWVWSMGSQSGSDWVIGSWV